MTENLYFNFISFGAVLAFTFTFPVGIYLLTIPKKSKATKHLGLAFVILSFISAAYILGFGFYEKTGAFHRWLSTAAALFGLIHLSHFFFHYPGEHRARFGKILLIAQYIIATITVVFWCSRTFSAAKIFREDGQYWDFVAPQASSRVAVVILLFIVLVIATGIWRTIVSKKGERWAVFLLMVSFIITTLTPGIANLMVRKEIIERTIFYLVYDLVTVLGWFFVIIFYLNLTKDRTSFMAKISGVSLATLLIIILGIGYFSSMDREKSFNDLHREKTARLVENPDYTPQNLEYIKKTGIPFTASRLICEDQGSGKHYIAFLHKNDSGETVEAGFNYIAYRGFIHQGAKKLVFTVAIIALFVLVGFRFFLRGALLYPLKRLIRGLQEVGKGKLHIELPIKVTDEVGFLTDNFNKMVKTILASKEQIEDYAHNLEEKVAERTEELQSAMEELEVTNEQLRETKDALWGEMALAKKIQTVLLPEKPGMDGYEIAAYMEAADEVGGDYYDVINAGGKDWIVIGDVSGHGVPAGLVMMMVQTSIHTVIENDNNLKPSEVLSKVNKVIHENIQKLSDDRYMTITVFAYLNNGEFNFSGLHQDILIYKAKTATVELVETDGIWLGITDDIRPMVGDGSFSLDQRDVMLVYTDGITEAWKKGTVKNKRDARFDMFGQERLAETFQKLGGLPPTEIKDGILNDMINYETEDDVTMMILKRL